MTPATITIEIAQTMHAALTAAVAGALDDGPFVYARGVVTDIRGVIDENQVNVDRQCPMVDIIPNERAPQQYQSALRQYNVSLRVVTYGPDDQWQVDLYKVADKVGDWLAGAPTLPLTLAKFDSLVVPDNPDVGTAGEQDTQQFMQWEIIVHTRIL